MLNAPLRNSLDLSSAARSTTSDSFPTNDSLPTSEPDSRHESWSRPVFGGQLDLPRPPSPSLRGSSVLQQPNSSATPHPEAAPFIPNGHLHNTFDPHISPTYHEPARPGLDGTTADYKKPLHTSRGLNDPSLCDQQQKGAPLREHHPSAYNFESQATPQVFNSDSTRDPRFSAQVSLLGAYEQVRVGHPDAIGLPKRGFVRNLEPPRATPTSFANSESHEGTVPTIRPIPSNVDPQTFFMITAHLHDQFGNPNLADCVLHVSHSRNNFSPFPLAAHAVLLARSPRLRAQFNAHVDRRNLTVTISDRFLTDVTALHKALRRLYGGELPDIHFASRILGYIPGSECMRFALSYTAAGHFLQIDEIAARGIDLASDSLSFETIGPALAFSLDGGISPSWHPRDGPDDDHESSISSAEDAQSKPEFPAAYPTYGFYSDRLLHHILSFVLQHLHSPFSLNVRVPELSDSLRLPLITNAQHARSNTRLTQIRFGEISLGDRDADFNHDEQALSSVLLSLPYPLLKHLLELELLGSKLGQARVTELAQAIISERERRRKNVARQSESKGPHTAAEEGQWRNLRWAEGVEKSQQHPCGFRLVRHHLGAETPTSSKS